MRGKRSAIASAALVIVTAAFAAPAAQGAVTVGEVFPPSPCAGNGFVNLTFIQSQSPGNQYVVPERGVITGFSYQAGSSPPTGMKLKVVRPTGGGTYTIVGESPVKAPVAGALNTFTDISIPVQPGDIIGFYFTSGGQCARMASSSYVADATSGDPPPGTTSSFGGAFSGTQLDVAAILEPQAARTLVFDASKSKVKKGKRVKFSGTVDAPSSAACEADQAVELQRIKNGVPSAVAQTQTTSAGAFAFSLKPKKTFSYQAEVSESDTCAGQVSNQEKVRVKKPG
jgi:hypothetical protein